MATTKKTAPKTNGSQETITKVEAARRVFAKHGIGLKPPEIMKLVKDEHGMDLTIAHASNLKSTLAKEMSSKASTGKAKKKPGPKAKVTPRLQLAAAQTSSPVTRRGITSAEVAAVKVLMRQLGAEELKRLIDVLGA